MVTGKQHRVVQRTCTTVASSVLARSRSRCCCLQAPAGVEASPNCRNGRQQDRSRGTRHAVRVCLHVIFDGTYRYFRRAYDSPNVASAAAKVRAVYA